MGFPEWIVRCEGPQPPGGPAPQRIVSSTGGPASGQSGVL